MSEEHVVIRKISESGVETFNSRDLSELANEYINRKKKLPTKAVEIIINNINEIRSPLALSSAIFALSRPQKTYDGQFLAKIYEKNTDRTVRTTISSTILSAKPLNINSWIKEIIFNETYSEVEKYDLFPALAKMLPQEEALSVLRKSYEKHPGLTARGWAICGREDELKDLENDIDKKTGWEKKEFKLAIGKLTKKLKTN